jgi:hypothetical protein
MFSIAEVVTELNYSPGAAVGEGLHLRSLIQNFI